MPYTHRHWKFTNRTHNTIEEYPGKRGYPLRLTKHQSHKALLLRRTVLLKDKPTFFSFIPLPGSFYRHNFNLNSPNRNLNITSFNRNQLPSLIHPSLIGPPCLSIATHSTTHTTNLIGQGQGDTWLGNMCHICKLDTPPPPAADSYMTGRPWLPGPFKRELTPESISYSAWT